MNTRLLAIALVLCASRVALAEGPGAPVAQWDSRQGSGDILEDSVGANPGRIHGPTWVKTGIGHTLWFNGLSDYVDCGRGAALDLRKEVSVEAWVMPEDVPDGEPSIAGKGPNAYGLTYFENGDCYWYIATGANHLRAPLPLGEWSHVVGTYDGARMALYVNGEEAAAKPLDVPIKAGAAFLIGRCAGRKGQFFGAIGFVRVYARGLSAEEIARYFKETSMGKVARPELTPDPDALVLKSADYSVAVTERGALRVRVGEESYLLETTLSYPGEAIGWNALGWRQDGREERWEPRVSRTAVQECTISAAGGRYALTRTIAVDGHRVTVEDTLTNTGKEDVGILYRHRLSAAARFTQRRIAGAGDTGVRLTSENPSVFVGLPESRLGWIAEDTVGRLQLALTSSDRRVRMSADHFALRAGTSHTFRWALYPLPIAADYWTFVNHVRRDWGTNFTVLGPWAFVNAYDPLLGDVEKLRAHLKRKRVRIAALTPWVAYFDGSALSREEHKALLQKAIAALKRADPNIKCVGCVESNIVSVDRKRIGHKELFDEVCRESGRYPLAVSAEHTRVLDELSPWADSLVKTADGMAMIEDCFPKSYVHQMVYSEPGNYQARHLMDTVKFLIDEVGTDGVYLDQFNQAFEARQRYHYGKWDGVTVDIDPTTGKISRRYTDGALTGVPVRKGLCEYVLSRGKICVANTHAAVPEMQALPVFRFMEAGSTARSTAWNVGQKPPLRSHLCKGHFDAPIGLGVPSSLIGPQDKARHAQIITKAVIFFLRHGLLYYHYSSVNAGANPEGTFATDVVPKQGPGAGGYGPVNHMFPMTPVELHAGWIVGRERTVACVSGAYRWAPARRPNVLVFDIRGRRVKDPLVEVNREGDGWRVALTLEDWAEIAVIE